MMLPNSRFPDIFPNRNKCPSADRVHLERNPEDLFRDIQST